MNFKYISHTNHVTFFGTNILVNQVIITSYNVIVNFNEYFYS
jgi:hypothetical protein